MEASYRGVPVVIATDLAAGRWARETLSSGCLAYGGHAGRSQIGDVSTELTFVWGDESFE